MKSPRTGKVKGFRRYVPYTTKDGRKTRRMQFMARKDWPSAATLKRMGIRESLAQIEKNNLADLSRGRKRRSKSRSSQKGSKRKSSRQSRKPRKPQGARMSAHEKAFRKHYSRPDAATTKAAKKAVTTKNLRQSMMYGAPSGKTSTAKKRGSGRLTNKQVAKLLKIQEATVARKPAAYRYRLMSRYLAKDTDYVKKRPKLKLPSNFVMPLPDLQHAELVILAEDVGNWYGNRRGDLPFKLDDPDHESLQKVRQLIKQRGGKVTPLTKKRLDYIWELSKQFDYKQLGFYKFHEAIANALEGGNPRDKIPNKSSGASVSRSHSLGAAVSRSWKKSHPRDKSGRFVSPRKGKKSRSKSSKKEGSREWSKKKNQALRRLMKREFGHILSKAEYKALPKAVQRELQLQAYESAYPEKVKNSPDRLLSNKALSKRVSTQAKKAKKEALKAAKKARKSAKSSSRSAAKSRSGGKGPKSRAPMFPEGKYPGEAQAIQDFIAAYAGKEFKSDAARLAAMTKDLKKSKKVVKRSTSYDAWKKEPWEYDLGGIDTEGSDDSFMRQLRSKGFMSDMDEAERKKYY